jgi:hypothetical protein
MAQQGTPAQGGAPARPAAATPTPAQAQTPQAANTGATATASNRAAPATGVQPVFTKPPTKQGNKIILENNEERTAYIRRRFGAEGADRGVIAKELGVAYQIVFAATRGWTKGAGITQKTQPASVANAAAQGGQPAQAPAQPAKTS